jgi:hypothetical protein
MSAVGVERTMYQKLEGVVTGFAVEFIRRRKRIMKDSETPTVISKFLLEKMSGSAFQLDGVDSTTVG